MKLDELIRAFQNGAAAQNELLTQSGLAALQAYLGAPARKLRLFVARAAGFGQQATTVTILHRFIGLGYAGIIQVIYDATAGQETPTTIEKLAVLLPGLDPANPQPLTINGVKVEFYAYTDGKAVAPLASDPQPLCVTGGTEVTTNQAAYFNVAYYLQLQPFQWEKDENLLWKKGAAQATNLAQVSTLGGAGQWLNRAFYADAPTLDPADWKRLAQVPHVDQAMLDRAQTLVNAVTNNSPSINFLPVHGLYPGKGRRALAGTNLDIVVGLVASVATAYDQQFIPQRVTVISLLNTFGGSEETFWNELGAFFDSLETLNSVDQTKLSFTEKKQYATKKWLKDKGITKARVTLLSGGSGSDLQSKIQQAPNNGLILMALPSPPPLLFNYLYRIATLPGVFEDQGTANLALNLGKPYFQLAARGKVPYPSRLLAAVTEAVPSGISERLTNLQVGVYGDAGKAFGAVAQLLRECLTPGSPQAQYFAALGEFYHKDQNDKLLLALLYWFHIIEPAPTPNPLRLSASGALTAGADDDPLQALYDKLSANITDGTLNLIPGVLASGTLVDYLAGLVGGAKLTVQEVMLSPSAGPVAPGTEVTITGNTANFTGVALPLSLVFTLDEDGTGINAVPTLAFGPFELPGVPWFTLQNASLAVTVPGNGDRLTGQAKLGLQLGEQQLDLVSDFPTAENQLLLAGTFGDVPPSIDRVLQLLGGVNFVDTLPDGLRAPSTLSLQSVQLAYDYKARALNTLNLSLKTTKQWPIIGKLRLDELLFDVVVTDPVTSRCVSWAATSTLLISPPASDKPGKLAIDIAYPALSLTGQLADDSPPIPVGELLTFFLNDQVTLNLGATLTSCSLYVVPGQDGVPTTLQASATLDTPAWNVSANGITFGLTNLGVEISNGEAGTTGKLTATTALFQDDPALKITFDLTAEYVGHAQGWQFTGQQTGNAIKIKDLLAKYVAADWGSDAVPNVEVSELAFDITAGGSDAQESASAYAISGKVAVWNTPLGDTTDKRLFKSAITAELGYGGDKPGRYGCVAAAVSWHNIDLLLKFNYDPDYQKFSITWNGLVGEIEKTVLDGKTHYLATLTFQHSVTLGSLIETCVSWATGVKFGLGAPWNILDEVSLSGLELKYDFTDKTVKFNVAINPIELGFARLDGISVSYQSGQLNPEDNGVLVAITGSFRWQDQDTPSQRLEWDAAKPETTPAPAGQGNKYFDLRLLALGQHVALSDLKDINKVQEAIALMAKDLPEPESTSGKLYLPSVTLDPDSSWLVGMDFGVLKLGEEKPAKAPLALAPEIGRVEEAVYLPAEEPAEDAASYFLTLQIVFNDPNLYALRLALDGAPAKIFKGLDFQILYKKVSDTVGVYMAEIALPDVMRQIKLGTFNITLPIFAIQVYTNGDFMVDIGFPWNQDFSRSLTFQGIIITPVGVPLPVMGSAGLYFGKLSSATTDRVPSSPHGTFNPVLVFGFGLQFGLGYSFEAGILKAGFSLTALAILEGILAKWNPYQLPAGPTDNTQLETAYYFWFRGTVGLMGKLYGSVDFAIIKAELNIDITLIVQLTFAPYEPISLSITATVDVGLTVTINLGLFKIHISFSFSARISQQITIQAIGGQAPWADGPARNLLGRPLRTRQLPALSAPGFRRRPLQALAPAWANLLKADALAPLRGYLGLGLTMAGDAALTPADQVACYVSMLFLESVPPPQADHLRRPHSSLEDNALPEEDTSFEQLCQMLFRWVVAALQPAPLTSAQVDQCLVTDAQLKQLLEYLSNRDNPIPLAYADLEQFLADQFSLTITTEQTTASHNATYFPVPNALSFSLPAYGAAPALAYSYGDYNQLDASYIGQLAEYFDALAVQQAKSGSSPRLAEGVRSAPSMGSFVFSDYFLLLCRQMVQAGRDALRDFKYCLPPDYTPAAIVDWARTNGQANYDLSELFADNATLALNEQAGHLTIGGSHYLVQAGDTFARIAQQALYGSGFDGQALALLNSEAPNLLQPGSAVQYPGQPVYQVQAGQSLTEVATALGVAVADLLAKSNVLTLSNLLLPVVPLAVPDFGYAIASGDTLRSIAAKFGITAVALAQTAANAQVANLFEPSVRAIDLVELQQLNVGAILQEIKDTQGLQHLSGMASRYYLAGLRLPTPGITPQHPGMWVTKDPSGALKLPPLAGLYALTGQQFPLPVLVAGSPLDITFASAASWLRFSGAMPQQAVVSIDPAGHNAQQLASVRAFATQNRLEVGTTFLGASGNFKSAPATFPFTSAIAWSSAAAPVMPYGGAPAGLPSLKLWQLPDTLLQLPNAKRAINPKVRLLAGHYDSATGTMENSPIDHYGYATVVEFAIKKIPVVSTSPATQTTYEIAGADGTNAEILEKIVAGVGTDDSQIASLFLAYSVGATAATPQGIQTDDPQFLTIGVAQVNLSTDTHPSRLFADRRELADAAPAPGQQLLNTPTGLLTLLWEASVTRAGGFYLYYYNAESGTGLPDSIFNTNQEATLHLVVLYARPSESPAQDRVPTYLNALATAEALDTTSAVLFAEAAPDPVSLLLPSGSAWTLAQLAYSYFGNVADVAADNQAQPLKPGTTLRLTEGTYEVGPVGRGPGGILSDIAAYFGTTAEAIKQANPLRPDWPLPPAALPLFTALLLPPLTITVGTSPGGATLGGLAAYYGQNLASLAAYNQDVVGLFADGATLLLAAGPTVRSSTVPAGVVALEAVRPMPLVPDDPADPNYGQYFLQNNFSLLNYQLVENEVFKASPLGLPAGPTSQPAAGGGKASDKIRAPRMLVFGDDWVYRQSIPYSRFAKHAPQAIAGLPDPATSPYQGLGSLLKVDFSWQDYYGNQLLTTLAQPGDAGSVLNQPPVLTGYTDPLLALSQWPSVGASWQVSPGIGGPPPLLQVQLSFDATPYEGLYRVVAQDSQTVVAYFTQCIEATSAIKKDNYALVQQTGPAGSERQVMLSKVVLNPDQKSVTLTVDHLEQDENKPLRLTIGSISPAVKSPVAADLSFSGVAKFFYAPEALPSATPVTDSATRDQQVYEQLWYQLTDPNGVRFSIVTGLLQSPNVLTAAQAQQLLAGWLAPIYLFLADRAAGGTTVAAPPLTHDFAWPLDLGQLNGAQIFQLDLAFCIERTGGAVAGDFETTGGIKQVSTTIVPLSTKAGTSTSYSFDTFAQQFEAAIQEPGRYAVRVASGTDRTAPNGSAGSRALWAVRHDASTGIGYQVTNAGRPDLFAPAPISNKLESWPQVPIYDFDPQTGINFDVASRSLDFAGIDMDVWGRQFFTAIDHVLSPEYTAAIQLIDARQHTSYYADILRYKTQLADIVKDWLLPVFQDAASLDPTAVRETFRQLLLVQLGNAYTTSAAVQFAAEVAAQVPPGIAPRLYGALNPNFRFLGAALDDQQPQQLTLFFNSELNAEAAANPANYSLTPALQVQAASLDPATRSQVTLTLSGPPAAGTTQVTIAAALLSSSGVSLLPPLSLPVTTHVAAGNYSAAVSLTSAKLALAPTSGVPIAPAAPQPLTFLITSPQVVKAADGAVIPYLDLDLTYAGSQLEHQIVDLKNGNGYQASSWLNFLTEAGAQTFAADLGQFSVPLLLRSFPTPPAMLKQWGQASAGAEQPAGQVDFATLLNWDYYLTYSEPFHFPQDKLSFTINFNVRDELALALTTLEDASGELAEFVTVFPAVSAALSTTLAGISATSTDAQLAAGEVALKAFDELVGRVVRKAAGGAGLRMVRRLGQRASHEALPYIFDIQESQVTMAAGVEALVISLSTVAPDGMVPSVELDGCQTHPYTALEEPAPAYAFYFTDSSGAIITAAEGQQKPRRTLVLGGLNILQRQDAETVVELKRNVEPIKRRPSANDFVYTTGPVSFSDKVHPTISHGEALDISTLPDHSATHNTLPLAQHLDNLLDALLLKNTQPALYFQLSCSYDYSLGSGLSRMVLPLLLQPLTLVQVQDVAPTGIITRAQLVANLAGGIQHWYQAYQPSTTDAAFRFDLTLFSNLTEHASPLLKLTDLSLPVQYITGL
jgi:LysM repeat protein